MSRRGGRTALAALAWLALAAPPGGTTVGGPSAGKPAPPDVTFRDVTRASGIRFTHQYDLGNAKALATQGGGAAFADYDGDGRLDLYTVGSIASYKVNDKTGQVRAEAGCGKLWHNEGLGSDGIPRFREVTPESGIVACGWGQGAYWADIDGDGDDDLLLTNAGHNQLYVNEGPGAVPRFADRSQASGLGAAEGFHVGAGFLDADKDGDVDVYIADYLVTDIDHERKLKGTELKTPEDYEAAPNHFYVNDGHGV